MQRGCNSEIKSGFQFREQHHRRLGCLSQCTKEFRCPRGIIEASFTRHCAAYSLQITAVLFRLECASEVSGHLSDEAGPRFDGFCLSQPKTDKAWLMAASTYYQRTWVSIKVEIDCSWAAIRNFTESDISRIYVTKFHVSQSSMEMQNRSLDYQKIIYRNLKLVWYIIDIFGPVNEKDLGRI